MDAITCGSDQRNDFLNSSNVMSENWFSPTAGRNETRLNICDPCLKNSESSENLFLLAKE